MENKVISRLISPIVKREWSKEGKRIGFTEEMILEVTPEFYQYAESIGETWNEHQEIYRKMCEELTGTQWAKLMGKKIFYIHTIKLEEENRGKGYGKKILKQLEQYAKNEKVDKIFLVIEDLDEMTDTEKEKEIKEKKLEKWFSKNGYIVQEKKERTYMSK